MKKLIMFLFLLSGCIKGTSIEDTQESYYVWYSYKQQLIMQSETLNYNLAILDNGSIVVYTELTKTKKPSGVFDDYIYLGRGKGHKVL